MEARCQFTIYLELATGKWQSDANSILEDFILFQVNWIPHPLRQTQPDVSSHILVNGQLAVRCQLVCLLIKTIKAE